MKEIRVSACFTNYNRTNLLFRAVAPFITHGFIDEIVISDDCSTPENFEIVRKYYSETPKVKLYRNEVNLDCYHNKAKAVELASNNWVFLLDSDNEFSKEFIDRIETLTVAGLNDMTVYAPSFARPHFDFTSFAGVNISRSNIAGLVTGVQGDKVTTMLNAMNYFVRRDKFLGVFDYAIKPVTSDSVYQNTRWLERGGSIYVVPELSYQHTVNNHGGEEPSHYGTNVRKTPQGLHDSIIQRLKNMK